MTRSHIIQQCVKLKQQKKGIAPFLKKHGYSDREIENFKVELRGDQSEELPRKNVLNDDVLGKAEWKNGLKFTEKYVYNKETDKYVIYLKAANGNIVLSGDVVRSLVENYSNWYGKEHSINEICRNFKIPRNYFNELKDILGITHDSEPITNEELLERDVDEITEDLLQKKKFQLYQQFQKRSWEQTQDAADKWFKMQVGVYDPFTEFLNSWEPPAYTPIKYSGPPKGKSSGKTLLVGLSDIHFGAKTNARESYRGKGYSTEEAIECLETYSENIKDLVEERCYTFDSCLIASLGDILHTTGAGFTTKGTMLVHDCIKEEQFNFAFDSIVHFISDMLSLFPRVDVKSVKGNHNDFGDYVLFKAISAYFRSEPRIAFDNFQTDHGLFKVNKCLFIISHGYSAEYKGRLPAAGKARESYITNLFLSKPEELIGVNQKVLLTADQHHLEMREYAEFEHYMLSTAVRGDKHSEAMGMNNAARQSCFVIGNEGIKEILYCYSRKN